MNSYIKSVIKTIVWTILAIIVLGVAFVVITIFEVPEERIQKFNAEIYDTDKKIAFEQGAIVQKNSLEFFYNFTEEKFPFKNWMKQNKNEINILNNGDIVFNKDIEIQNMSKNHCSSIYCYQKRMTFEKIPGVFWKGLIGIEDYRFLEHHGIDPKSILRAIITDIKAMKMVQGGSTLTQQLVKNLFYSNEKKISRKIKEMIVALYIESKYTKENILESYFNEVFWGSLNGIRIKGINAATLFYFNKTPQEIQPFEAAILIGLLKGPNYYHPVKRTDRLKKRATVVFNKLQSLKLFSTTGIKKWNEKKWTNWIKQLENKSNGHMKKAIWRTTVLKQQTPFNKYEAFSLNYEVEKLKDFIKKKAPKKDVAIKFLISDIETRKSISYYSKFERNMSRAINEEFHQVGSTLKPIAYNIFGNFGYTLDNEISTLPIKLKLKSGNWSPREAHKIASDNVTLREALLLSYNRPVIRISNDIGFTKIEQELIKFIPKIKVPLSEYPAQLLGSVELSVQELWDAYYKFINKECLGVAGLKKPWEETILFQMSNPEETTVRRLVGKQMGRQRFFGKTGTSNKGFDNWYIFFDGKYLGVIWVGLEGSREGAGLGLYGGTTSFRLYKAFMRNRGKRFNELSCDFFSKKNEY